MLNQHLCPLCSYPLLRHIRGGQPYWFCRHCHQEVPYSICGDRYNRDGDRDLPQEKVRVFVNQFKLLEVETVAGVAEIPENLGQSSQGNEILTAAVVELRQFLQTDRVIICKFAEDGKVPVIAESLTLGRNAMLGLRMDHLLSYGEIAKFQEGKIQIIEDIDSLASDAYPLKRLEKFFGVKAKIAIAIPLANPDLPLATDESPKSVLTQNSKQTSSHRTHKTQDSQLWGLLIAHQCSQPRQWEELEISIFSLIAKQIAIGIQQHHLTQKLPSISQKLQIINAVNNQVICDNRNSLEKAYIHSSNSQELLMSYVAYFVSRGQTLSSPIDGNIPFQGLVYEYWGYHQDFQDFWQKIQDRRDFNRLYIEGDICNFEDFLNGSLTVSDCAICNLPKPIPSSSIYNLPDCSLCQKNCLSGKCSNKSTGKNFNDAPDTIYILAIGKSPTNSDPLKQWFSLNRFEVTFILDPVYIIDRLFTHDIDLILIHGEVSETLGKTWANRLRCHPQLRDVPIIALSANAGYGLPWVERNTEIEDYLIVPLNGENLVTHLHQLSQLPSSACSNEVYWFPL